MPAVSVFTPTHDPKNIMDAFNSLERQTFKDFEWVIIPNKNGHSIPEIIQASPFVRIIEPPIDIGQSGSVGALKKFAVDNCQGDLLVELDHDDFLTDNCLQRLTEVVRDTEAGFVYSDWVSMNPNHSSVVYSRDAGWQTYNFNYDGRRYDVCKSFPLQPSAFLYLQYMPNHVRAWTREAYTKAGGYYATEALADDYSLMCRTYLSGIKMQHIPECLYFYRVWDQSTVSTRNAELQTAKNEVVKTYFDTMCRYWARENGLESISISHTDANAVGLTSCRLDELNRFEPDSVGYVSCLNCLQHLESNEIIPTFNKLYEIMAPKAWARFIVPSTDGRAAFMPGYKSLWNQNSFWAFANRKIANEISTDFAGRFGMPRCWTAYPDQWHKTNRMLYTYVDLVALKGQHHPGTQNI